MLLKAYAARGDAAAFAELVRRYADMVYATARRVTGSGAIAEDVAQDCFLRLAQASATVRGSLGAWLHRTCLNRSLEILRSEKARARREVVAAEVAQADAAASTADAAELIERVDEALAALPDELRAVLTEHFLCGKSQVEIAQSMKLSQPTVSRRIEKGLERLRHWLSENGVVGAVGVLPVVLAEAGKMAAPAGLRSSVMKIGLSGVGGAGVRGPAVKWPWFAQPAALVTITILSVCIMGACVWWVMKPVSSTQLKVRGVPAAASPASPPLAAVAGAEAADDGELQGVIAELPVAELSVALQFYAKLGFEPVGAAGNGAQEIDKDDERLILTLKKPPFVGPVSIRIAVKNVPAYRKQLEGKKVAIASSPDGNARSFAVTDGDGNRIVFEEEGTR